MSPPLSIPDAFVQLHRAGRFDYWGAPYHSLTVEQRQALVPKRLPQVLWWNGVEWEGSPEEIAAFEDDGWLRPGLFPFAGDGAGDRYC
jgi:hypothetical protein